MERLFEPLPLVIGVTGHRDLREEDIPDLRKAVEGIFDRLHEEYAVSHPLSEWLRPRKPKKLPGTMPMVVVSALAEGADQLVAEVAVERGLRVIAALPLPEEEYRRDFEQHAVLPDALEKFDRWMSRPIGKLIVGCEDDDTAADVRGPGGVERTLQYRRAGAFIVRHCHVLIALWDGDTGHGTGGTAEVVGFNRHGIPPAISGRLDAPEIGPVIHVVTPRAAAESTVTSVSVRPWGAEQVRHRLGVVRKDAGAAEVDALEHDLRLWKFFETSLAQSRKFNSEAADLCGAKRGYAELRESLSWLFEGHGPPEVATPRERASVSRYSSLYAVADVLAHQRQRTLRRQTRLLAVLGLLAFLCLEAFSHLAPIASTHMSYVSEIIDISLLSGYLMAFAAAGGVLYLTRIRKHQERFLDCRALAEALRVAVFWRLAGIVGVADAYPIKTPGEPAWVKTSLMMQELLDRGADGGASAAPGNPDYETVRDIWIRGQLSYFTREARRMSRQATWWSSWSARLLVAAFGIAAMLLALMLIRSTAHGESIRYLLLFLITYFLGVAAAFVTHSENIALDEQALQDERMAAMFERAETVLSNLGDADRGRIHQTLRELGVEVMRDNAEWVSTRRHRPIRMPQA